MSQHSGSSGWANLFMAIVLIGGLAAAVHLGLGKQDWMTAGCIVLVMITAYRGYRAGACRIVASVIGLLAASKYAVTTGPFLENWLQETLGVTGVVNRLAGIGMAGLLIAFVVAVVLGIAASFLLKCKPSWQNGDRCLGTMLGICKGCLMVALAGLALLTVEPMVAQRLAATSPFTRQASAGRVASNALALSKSLRESAVGKSLNSMQASPWFGQVGQAEAIAEKISSPASFEETFYRLSDNESLLRLARDPAVRELLTSGQAFDPTAILSLMDRPEIQELNEDPQVMAELSKLLGS